MEQKTLEQRGDEASKEIAEVLKKYNLALAVNIEGARPFIESLKPTLIDATDKEENA